jgi:hypothetical protein
MPEYRSSITITRDGQPTTIGDPLNSTPREYGGSAQECADELLIRTLQDGPDEDEPDAILVQVWEGPVPSGPGSGDPGPPAAEARRP